MRRLFPHKFNKSPFNQNSKLTIGEVSFILKQTVVQTSCTNYCLFFLKGGYRNYIGGKTIEIKQSFCSA